MNFKLMFEDLKKIVESNSETELQEQLEKFFTSKEAEISTVFEKAVEEKVKEKEQALEEEYKAKLEASVEESINAIAETLEIYMDTGFEKMVEANVNEFGDEIRMGVVESVYDSFKGVLAENGFDVDPEQSTLIDDYKGALEEAENKINQLSDIGLNLAEELKNARFTLMVNEMAKKSELSDVDSAQFAELAEGLNYSSDEELHGMLSSLISEKFTKTADGQENINEEDDNADNKDNVNLSESDKATKRKRRSIFDYN